MSSKQLSPEQLYEAWDTLPEDFKEANYRDVLKAMGFEDNDNNRSWFHQIVKTSEEIEALKKRWAEQDEKWAKERAEHRILIEKQKEVLDEHKQFKKERYERYIIGMTKSLWWQWLFPPKDPALRGYIQSHLWGYRLRRSIKGTRSFIYGKFRIPEKKSRFLNKWRKSPFYFNPFIKGHVILFGYQAALRSRLRAYKTKRELAAFSKKMEKKHGIKKNSL
jgi:hypothetical protein